MSGKKADLGPTGMNVAANVRRFRDGLTYAELSRRLEDAGRPIPPLGLRRIESGDRRVDADDLVALAVALGVSPVALLMPADVVETTAVAVTGRKGELPAESLYEWLTNAAPFPGDNVMPFFYRSRPPWQTDKVTIRDFFREGGFDGDD